MRNVSEIQELLKELDARLADELEGQDLDFKEWDPRSRKTAVGAVIEMAICMANGGGGTVVFGVNDKAVGREKAILGVPPEVDVNLLKKAVYDSTDPKLTPVFEELAVPEGTGRLLVMQIHPGLPPYTDTAGGGKVRIGRDCMPLTGTLRRRIMVETGETDLTAVEIPDRPSSAISAVAMEQLREASRKERAPEDLLKLTDLDLLAAMGVLRNGRLTRAGLLLAGKNDVIEKHLPGYVWTHLRMKGDTQYVDRMDGRDAIPIALGRVSDRIMADNPITTVEYGMFHFEYRTYPEVAIREALMNAFCHADYRITGPILVRQFRRKLEVGNPGGFVGGVSPDNILHHDPVARNPHLVDALTRLRLVNRSNLGVPRMFHAMLVEGKEPPVIEGRGESVKVTFLAGQISASFRAFVEEESKRGYGLGVDHLLILQYLLRHAELDTATAVRLCQRPETEIREVLSEMERGLEYLERGGTGRGTYWVLRPELHRRLSASGHPERDRRIDWEAAKTRVLSVLKMRAERSEPGLTNREIRQITHLDRGQTYRLMRQLIQENPAIKPPWRGRYARYEFKE
ncbi:MAG: AAA family ATPase [Deltaproteobacteria bacterium RBG_16_48_10]|nr:MAG: AAA family ATPase [Deltaproteobacteria bacterium RBG_16_48_10]